MNKNESITLLGLVSSNFCRYHNTDMDPEDMALLTIYNKKLKLNLLLDMQTFLINEK